MNDLLGVELDAEDAAAGRDRSRRLRQHRRGASVSPAFLDQYVARRARRRRSSRSANPMPKRRQRQLSRRRSGDQDGAHRRPAARHARRHEVQAQLPGRRRIPVHDPGSRRRTSTRARSRREHTLVILVDGREVFRASIGGAEDCARRSRRRARTRRDHEALREDPGAGEGRARTRSAVTFIERARASNRTNSSASSGRRVQPAAMREPRPGRRRRGDRDRSTRRACRDTASRGVIFVCEPETQSRGDGLRADSIAANLARRAFRRPVDRRATSIG